MIGSTITVSSRLRRFEYRELPYLKVLSNSQFDGVFDEEGGDDLFDGQLVVVGKFLDLFPVLQKFLIEHLRLAFRFVENEFVGHNIEGLRFNVAVAQLYELSNALSASLPKRGSAVGASSGSTIGLEWAIREAGELLVQMLGPMMPHLGEEGWARLGYNTLLAEQPWPKADPALLVDDTVVIAVQLNGKRRAELTIARTATKDEVETAALKLEAVVRLLDGQKPKKVIVVPQRIVNVVV